MYHRWRCQCNEWAGNLYHHRPGNSAPPFPSCVPLIDPSEPHPLPILIPKVKSQSNADCQQVVPFLSSVFANPPIWRFTRCSTECSMIPVLCHCSIIPSLAYLALGSDRIHAFQFHQMVFSLVDKTRSWGWWWWWRGCEWFCRLGHWVLGASRGSCFLTDSLWKSVRHTDTSQKALQTTCTSTSTSTSTTAQAKVN